jgi:hypothetical protein
MTAHDRVEPPAPGQAAPPAETQEGAPPAAASPFGLAAVTLGVLLIVAGPFVLASAILPQLLPTFGPEPLTFLAVEAPEDKPVLSLGIGALILPAAGFSLAYLNAGIVVRRRISAACTAWFAAQTLLLAAAVVWITGGGLDAGTLVGTTSREASAVIASPLGLLLCAAAAAIMLALSRRTTFDAQSDEYFGQGDAVVRVTPLSVAVHALWAVVAAAVWAAVVWLPVLAVGRVNDLELISSPAAGSAEPWPLYPHGDYEYARAVYAVVVGVILGAVASSLLKKVLYRTILRDTIGRTVPAATQNSWRSIQPFVHYPIAIAGGAATASMLFLLPVEQRYDGAIDTGGATLFCVIAAIATVAGVFAICSVWRSGDHPLFDSPLQKAMAGDIRGSFATPARRKSAARRPRSPKSHGKSKGKR